MVEQPRYIDKDKCIACGECANRCPKKVSSEYNEGLDKRKAAYVPYAQAVPLKYAIDKENCLYFLKGKCRACQKFCPTGAVDFEQQPVEHKINVGSVILAPGFAAFDPTPYDTYAYAQLPNVVSAIEFERILAASGPWLGHLVRPSDEAEPRRIAFLQCVGSRDLNACDHAYCSSVCCMYAVKEATIAMEHSKSDLDVSIFFMDMRTYGKDFEKYYNKAQAEGVNFVRSRIHTIDPAENDNLKIRYSTEDGRIEEEEFDLIVLSVGLETPPEVAELGRRLGIELDEHLFTATSTFEPVATSRPGVYVCGAFNSPKDIPISVMEASAAACAAGNKLSSARGSLTKTKEIPAETNVVGEPPRIGVFICHCGINIAGVVDVEAVADYAQSLPYVEYVERNLFSCSQDTQDKMKEVIKDKGLTRVVVAACTPRTHEPLFRETLIDAGLNKYLFEMANIRNQDSWVHADSPEKATEKAKDLVRMAVAKVALLEPLTETSLSVNQTALVIGGGVAGMNAALALAQQGHPVHLIEKSDKLGGNALNLYKTSQGELVADYLDELIAKVEAQDNLFVHLSTEIEMVDGFVGNFKTTVSGGSGQEVIEHGVAIIATGAKELKPEEYLYGQDERVLTAHEMDAKLKAGPDEFKDAKSAVFIQCVGSRNDERPYCSKVCCTHSVESALALKEMNPEMDVFIIYRDIRTYGPRELLYREARQKGVIFIRYDLDHKPEVIKDGDEIKVKVRDHVLGRELLIPADYVSLASAIVSNRDEELAQMFKVPLDEDGWFLEAHQKLRPVDFATDGVFLAGLAHYPKPLEESIAQAQAAVSRALTVLAKGVIDVGGVVSEIDQTKCVSCGVCIEVCPYQAIAWNDDNKAQVNEALCKGCGVCVASCRSGAPQLLGFTDAEVFSQIENV